MAGQLKSKYLTDGHLTIDEVFTAAEVKQIISIIDNANNSEQNFRMNSSLFAIRQFLKEVPAVVPHIFNERLCSIISNIFGNDHFVVKSIYFDKPAASNWFVSWHQDLTISVKDKIPVDGFGPWSLKNEQYAVQPPQAILENSFTIRIHLDDTNADNGALKVITSSHISGIKRADTVDLTVPGHTCYVPRGGIMIMSPLLFHSSSRTTNGQRRRVIHIEFCNQQLTPPLQWAESMRLQ